MLDRRSFGRFLGLEQVVLAKVKREGRGARVDAHLYDLRSRKRLSSVAGVKLPADEHAASLKLEEVAGALYLNVRYDGKTDEELRAAAERNRKPKEPPKPSGPPFYTKWWFWTIVGGVVVAGATPLVYSAFNEGGPSCPRAHCTELVWDY